MKLNEVEIINCKTIIVGNSGVGKTSIIGRYLGKYNPCEKPTIGAAFTNRLASINNKQILFEIWDTAGQEKYRSINSIFYQDAYICILVYDITNKKSFEDLKEYWHNSVLETGPEDIIFHIVGNKIDLYDKEEVDRNDVDNYCKEINADVSFVSTKDENNSYIDRLFNKLGEKFINSEKFKKKEELSKKNKMESSKKLGNNDEKKMNSKKKKCC